jgi:hypothetical protein
VQKNTPYLTTIDSQSMNKKIKEFVLRRFTTAFFANYGEPNHRNPNIYEEVINFYQSSCYDNQTIHHQHLLFRFWMYRI